MKSRIRIYLGFQENSTNPNLASQKQLDYIDGLLLKKRVVDFNSKVDGHRLTIKEASKFINLLLKGKPFILSDRDKNRELKSLRNKREEELKLFKWNKKQEERKKYAAIRSQKVKIKSNWGPFKPKTFDKILKISLAEQQANLNELMEK